MTKREQSSKDSEREEKKIEKREEVKRGEREKIDDDGRRLVTANVSRKKSKFTCRRFWRRRWNFRTLSSFLLVTKNHAHAFLSVRLQLSVFCAHSQKTTTSSTEKTREEVGLRAVRVWYLSLVPATKGVFPLSFFLFFSANFLSLSLVCLSSFIPDDE